MSPGRAATSVLSSRWLRLGVAAVVLLVLVRRLGAGRDANARLRLELWGAAALYLASIGWRTLVSGGICAWASSRSSKPMIATSSGMRRPFSRSARIAPIADSSLKASTALNVTPESMICCMA